MRYSSPALRAYTNCLDDLYNGQLDWISSYCYEKLQGREQIIEGSIPDRYNTIFHYLHRYSVRALNKHHYNEEDKANFWREIKEQLATANGHQYLTEENGKRILKLFIQVIKSQNYMDDGIILVLKPLMDRKQIEDLNSTEAKDLWTKAIEAIKANTGDIPAPQTYLRYNHWGNWRQTEDREWIRLEYHENKSFTIAPTTNTNELKFGLEREGHFNNKQQFQAAMDELSTTPFDGGFLLDQRNWILPTKDGSLQQGTACRKYGVEFVIAPFGMEKGLKFVALVDSILERHGFTHLSSEYCGCHCHIDDSAFNDQQKLALFKKVYAESNEQKLARYGRPESSYAKWTPNGGNGTIVKTYELAQGFVGKDNQPLYYQKESLELERGSHDYRRYHLLNFENRHTIELRGFSGDLAMTTIINNTFDLVKDILGL